MTLDFTQTQNFWDNVMINEGAVLQETSKPDSNGLVTKKFNAKSGTGNMDRVAFYLNLKSGKFNGETIGTHGSPL